MENNGKIVILDAGMYLHRAAYASKNNYNVPINYTILNMMVSNLRKIGISPYDKVIIAQDGRENWRKNYDKNYKANRKGLKDASGLDWEKIYKDFDWLLDRIDKGTDWDILKINNCLSGDTRISTPDGCKHINKVNKGDKVYSYNIRTKKLEISEVKNIQTSKSLHRYCIYFEGIKQPLKITGEHPIYTLKAWKKVNNLSIGDIVWHYFDAQLLNLKSIQKDLGYFNGYLLGDGYIDSHKKTVNFSGIDKESILYLKKLARRIFQIKTKLHKCKRKNVNYNISYSISMYGREKIYSIIHSNKFKKGLVYKKGFVAGFYDAEGTYNKKRNIIRITNTNKKLINYVFEILEEFKFNPKLYKFIDKRKNRRPCYAIDLNGKVKIVRFFQTFQTIIKRKKINTISNGLKIRRIEHILESSTYNNYNFESVPNNNYFANGVLVHNCEADDIASAACRYYTNNEIVLISFDSDWEMLMEYPNVKVFSPLVKYKSTKGAYKVKPENFNVYKILAKKIRKETSDNLVEEILTEEDYETRMQLVNLLKLPEFIENMCIMAFKELKEKEEVDISCIPFDTLICKIEGLYNDNKSIITYEDCEKYNEKKILKKKKKLKKKT